MGPPNGGFVDEFRVRQQGPGHGDHVRLVTGQYLFGHFRGVDAVAGDQWHRHLLFQPGRGPGKPGPGHHGREGGGEGLLL